MRSVAILSLNLTPDGSGGLADAVFGDEFARHRGQHVIVFIERLQPFPAELALHGERDQQLSAH